MNCFLRQCNTSDLDKLRELSISTYDETFAHLNTPEDMQAYLDEAFQIEKLSAELHNPESSFYFLYDNQQVAGYLKLNEASAQSDIHDASSLEIERIYVASEFQGKGFGQFLMNQAISIASIRRKTYVWLGVWEKNEKAIQFYKKNGFYEIGTHAFVMGNDVQRDFVMRKDLI